MDANLAILGPRRDAADTSDASSIAGTIARASMVSVEEITLGGPLFGTVFRPLCRRRSPPPRTPEGDDFFSSALDNESKDLSRFDFLLLRQDPRLDLDRRDESSASIMASQVGSTTEEEFSRCECNRGCSFGLRRFVGEETVDGDAFLVGDPFI